MSPEAAAERRRRFFVSPVKHLATVHGVVFAVLSSTRAARRRELTAPLGEVGAFVPRAG
ncbi:protein of unknown function [Bradyrhizobium vignae]|uniref:Uncharacterized protein n=1 Tax=Bradyrhizobium vignae TaxID=1549949 RepID=A0A2U3Q1A1_9BRAD|nr:protein of unknown function [Bradyrhizobium vignae]